MSKKLTPIVIPDTPAAHKAMAEAMLESAQRAQAFLKGAKGVFPSMGLDPAVEADFQRAADDMLTRANGAVKKLGGS